MENSASIKRQNKNHIRKLLVSGKAYTKQQIAKMSGLSVASCNTYLNEMENNNEVLGERQQLNDVGRSSMVYRINEDFESIVCVYFELIQGIKSITATVLSPTGKIRKQQKKSFPVLDSKIIEHEIVCLLEEYPNASQIMVGTPSVAENGIIRHCDIPELENVQLKNILEEKFSLPTYLANDMYYKVYGYYCQEHASDEIITLVNFPSGVLPGTATVNKGSILEGKNLFAGMVGFLDYGMNQKNLLKALQRPTAEPLIVQATIALIAILNPHKILLTGDLLVEKEIERIKCACKSCIPEEYMPIFEFVPNTDQFYLAGMYWKSIDRKESNM